MTDNGLSRRAALGAAGTIAAGAVAGYVAGRNTDAADALSPATNGGGGYGSVGSPGGGSGQALAEVADIPDGGGVIVHGVVVTRTGQDVHAFSAVCTHQGCEVNKVSDGKIDCPCHGSVFDASTGAVVAGPAPSPLPAVAVTVRNGEVFST
jgi:Rieske Fe-S protein